MKKPSEDIIDKVLDNQASPIEAAMVAGWFATDEGAEYLSERMEYEYFHSPGILEYAGIEGGQPDRKKILELINKRIRRTKLRRRILSAAAVFIPLALIAGALLKVDSEIDLFGKTPTEEIAVAKGERVQVVFQDGSKVYLNSDSRLRYPRKFTLSNRKVKLEGEGYFVIGQNPERPFIVELEGGKVTVTGTSFDVKAYAGENEISVTLDEGAVHFSASGSNKRFNLVPGDRLVFDRHKGQGSIVNSHANSMISSWKDDVLMLNDQPLEEVVKILDRWFNAEFIIEDLEALKYSFTLVVSEKTTLDNVLRDLEKIAPVKFVSKGNKVIVRSVKK